MMSSFFFEAFIIEVFLHISTLRFSCGQVAALLLSWRNASFHMSLMLRSSRERPGGMKTWRLIFFFSKKMVEETGLKRWELMITISDQILWVIGQFPYCLFIFCFILTNWCIKNSSARVHVAFVMPWSKVGHYAAVAGLMMTAQFHGLLTNGTCVSICTFVSLPTVFGWEVYDVGRADTWWC